MKKEFEMTDLGLVKYFLGLEVFQNENFVHVSQKKYARDLLKQFNMLGCRAVGVPMHQCTKLQLNDEAESTNATCYRSLVGKLLYLTHTRPDLVFAVNLLSRHMTHPTKIHLAAAKQVLRYVSGTYDFGIQYNRNVPCVLEGYSDSDWSGDNEDRKSTTGVQISVKFVRRWLEEESELYTNWYLYFSEAVQTKKLFFVFGLYKKVVPLGLNSLCVRATSYAKAFQITEVIDYWLPVTRSS
ncbi:uncharacterized mitochondrial protein AtMg00810-like [Dioscorea cayenensis subsp. rotundata]|uniref:Uncharacterized mitochondrial protein AtMg00810-like n=1 Tax=Dioscorea cayennensis subsp. rotundata TaxID=55577 RepID=A0AB40CZY1_DIOCR|nr:uncharacterized mitochondrial protein AtMg00810-like [Dioscorea cayenensis subsp. rotundata]